MDDSGPIGPYQIIITVQNLSYTVLVSPETGSRVIAHTVPLIHLSYADPQNLWTYSF